MSDHGNALEGKAAWFWKFGNHGRDQECEQIFINEATEESFCFRFTCLIIRKTVNFINRGIGPNMDEAEQLSMFSFDMFNRSRR